MPRSIQIVKPFTTWGDFDADSVIDGLVVYVQPLNASDDPIQAAGSMYLELYEYRQASGERKGRRMEHWEFPLRTEADQRARWNRATLMYEFPVVLSRESLSAGPGDKLVLSVTHHSPLGGHRSDEYVINVPLSRKSFAPQAESHGP